MTSTALQQVSTEDVKQAIIALIKENNAEFKQLLVDLLPNLAPSAPKKAKKKQAPQNSSPVNAEHISYSEMPFWKANPHLKPHVFEGKGTDLEAFSKALANAHEAFKDISDKEWDDMLEQLKD